MLVDFKPSCPSEHSRANVAATEFHTSLESSPFNKEQMEMLQDASSFGTKCTIYSSGTRIVLWHRGNPFTTQCQIGRKSLGSVIQDLQSYYQNSVPMVPMFRLQMGLYAL